MSIIMPSCLGCHGVLRTAKKEKLGEREGERDGDWEMQGGKNDLAGK